MSDLEKIMIKAYTLAHQVLNGDDVDMELTEEVSGEAAEFLAILHGDSASFDKPNEELTV